MGVYTCQLLTFQCLGQEMVQKKSPIGESIREKDKLALHQNYNKTPQLMSCTCACVHSAQLSVVENSARSVCTTVQYSQSGPCLRVCWERRTAYLVVVCGNVECTRILYVISEPVRKSAEKSRRWQGTGYSSWYSKKKGSQENKEACSSKIPAVILVERLVIVMDPEELVVCPYDPVHRVARKRMQYHLIKCRKVSVRSTSSVLVV